MSETLGKREKKAHVFDRDEHDWYAEQEWVWRRLFEVETFSGSIYDPSCGRGNVVRSAREAGHEASGSDIALPSARGNPEAYPVEDFMATPRDIRLSSICSNPPFNLLDPRDGSPSYLRKALDVTTHKVVLLVPTVWLNARSGLRETPLYRVWLLTPRPSMPPGRLVMEGMKPGSGTKDFSLAVWLHGYDGDAKISWLHRDEGSVS